jgi:hypothetical protein
MRPIRIQGKPAVRAEVRDQGSEIRKTRPLLAERPGGTGRWGAEVSVGSIPLIAMKQ